MLLAPHRRNRFSAHPVEDASGSATLGWTCSDDSAEAGSIRLRDGSFVSVFRNSFGGSALLENGQNNCVSLVTRALVRREPLRVSNAAYSFIEQACGDAAVPVWPSAKREFARASHLIALAVLDTGLGKGADASGDPRPSVSSDKARTAARTSGSSF